MLLGTPSGLSSGVGEIIQLLHINVQRFRGGLVFKVHRLCVSLNSRLESNKEEDAEEMICLLSLDIATSKHKSHPWGNKIED